MTIIIYSKIADIIFYSETDNCIPGIQDGKFRLFTVPPGKPDVFHFFHAINDCDLILPPLTSSERDQISKCNLIKTINLSITTFPLVIFSGKIEQSKYSFFSAVGTFFDQPLLRSKKLRERLFECSDHYDQIYLILHFMTVEIRDYNLHRIDIYYPEEIEFNLQLDRMDNSIFRLFRTFNSEFNAFTLHSSAVIRRGKAVLFLAPDGGGKTTVAKQVSTNTVLGDDQIILRKYDGNFFAYSTPWNRMVNGSLSAPLGALFLLENAEQFELISLKQDQMIEYLWNEHIFFTNLLTKKCRVSAFNLLCDAVSQVPLFRIRTPLNGMDWAKIDNCL